jgi:hypothetical protein
VVDRFINSCGCNGQGVQQVLSKVLYSALSSIKKESQALLDLFGFWEQHVPYMGILSSSQSEWHKGYLAVLTVVRVEKI